MLHAGKTITYLVHVGHQLLQLPELLADPRPPLLRHHHEQRTRNHVRGIIIYPCMVVVLSLRICIVYIRTLSAMLRGCVAQPRLARTLNGTWSCCSCMYLSMPAISSAELAMAPLNCNNDDSDATLLSSNTRDDLLINLQCSFSCACTHLYT
jgi:hypothetical protein